MFHNLNTNNLFLYEQEEKAYYELQIEKTEVSLFNYTITNKSLLVLTS